MPHAAKLGYRRFYPIATTGFQLYHLIKRETGRNDAEKALERAE